MALVGTPMSTSPSTVFMARQPIYDRQRAVIGYELLFRRANTADAGAISRAESAQAVINSLVEIGLEELVGTGRAYINVGEDLLLEQCLEALPAERVVLEVLETVRPTPEVIQAVRRLKDLGYTIALDDFIYRPELEPLADLADIVKLDVLEADLRTLRKAVSTLKRPGVSLLAEKVETQSHFNRCLRLNFDFFQGYYFMRPQIITGQQVKANRASLLRLLARLQEPDISLREIEDVIRADVTLSYRLIKLTRSVDVAVRAQFETVAQAIQFLGIRKVTSIAMLLAMAGVDDLPQELVVTAFTRAHMCENLVRNRNLGDPNKAFLAGLLSMVDVIMNMPMDTALDMLPISNEIREALLDPRCPNYLARTLREVSAYERGQWDEVRDSNLGEDLWNAYIGAVRTGREVERAVAA